MGCLRKKVLERTYGIWAGLVDLGEAGFKEVRFCSRLDAVRKQGNFDDWVLLNKFYPLDEQTRVKLML